MVGDLGFQVELNGPNRLNSINSQNIALVNQIVTYLTYLHFVTPYLIKHLRSIARPFSLPATRPILRLPSHFARKRRDNPRRLENHRKACKRSSQNSQSLPNRFTPTTCNTHRDSHVGRMCHVIEGSWRYLSYGLLEGMT